MIGITPEFSVVTEEQLTARPTATRCWASEPRRETMISATEAASLNKSPQELQALQRRFLDEIQPIVARKAEIIAFSGLAMRQLSNGTIADVKHTLTPQQQAALDALDYQVEAIRSRLGLVTPNAGIQRQQRS